MSIRPVDMQTLLPRTHEVGRQQHSAEMQPQVMQHALSARAQERSAQERRQVRQKDPAEQAAIREDRRRGGGQGRSRKESESEQKERKAGSKGPEAPGNRLDVKL